MRCPGQDTQYWKPGAIYEVRCPQCGAEVEFFKDDTARRCDRCGHRFVNPQMDFGCAAYCPYAEQCLGTLPEELWAQKEDLLKERVAIEMKRHLKGDFKRIGHASRRARYAERIAKEEGGALPVVLCAAYLKDIGETQTRPPHAGDTAEASARQSVAVAETILSKLKARDELIAEVRAIVGRSKNPGPDDDRNSKIVWDAERIAGLEERQKKSPMDAERIEAMIDDELLTAAGKAEARRILMG